MPLSTVMISAGSCCRREPHDLRRQPIAVLKAVRHDEPRRHEAEPRQLPHDQRRARRAVGIEVADDDDATAPLEVAAEQLDGRIEAAELADRHQLIEAEIQIAARLGYPARRTNAAATDAGPAAAHSMRRRRRAS